MRPVPAFLVAHAIEQWPIEKTRSPACGRTGRVMLGKFDAADGLVVPDVDTAR